MKKFALLSALPALLCANIAAAEVTIYAAASLTDAVGEINKMYEQKYGERAKGSYASSGTLAKQIEHGAPADVFISADTKWVSHLAQKQKIIASSQRNLLGNRLVLITPKNKPVTTPIRMASDFNLAAAFTGKLCTGNMQSVPVGRYAKQALTHYGWLDSVRSRLVETQDVRAALNFVNRGECTLGIVYATDAAIAKNVKTIATFPLTSHTPIVYPIVMVKQNANTKRYYNFLQSSAALAVYRKYGFSVL